MIVDQLNESWIYLRNSGNSQEIPENENPKKGINIVQKILDSNKQQKDKRFASELSKHIKILIPKQILQ